MEIQLGFLCFLDHLHQLIFQSMKIYPDWLKTIYHTHNRIYCKNFRCFQDIVYYFSPPNFSLSLPMIKKLLAFFRDTKCDIFQSRAMLRTIVMWKKSWVPIMLNFKYIHYLLSLIKYETCLIVYVLPLQCIEYTQVNFWLVTWIFKAFFLQNIKFHRTHRFISQYYHVRP